MCGVSRGPGVTLSCVTSHVEHSEEVQPAWVHPALCRQTFSPQESEPYARGGSIFKRLDCLLLSFVYKLNLVSNPKIYPFVIQRFSTSLIWNGFGLQENFYCLQIYPPVDTPSCSDYNLVPDKWAALLSDYDIHPTSPDQSCVLASWSNESKQDPSQHNKPNTAQYLD